MGEVCVLPNRFISSLKGICLLLFYIILPSFINIGQELFEIIDIKTDRYGDFNISNGRGIHSTELIHLIIKSDLNFIILHHPAKFHQNRWRTFWDNRGKHSNTDTQTHTQTHRHTDRHIHADENNTFQKQSFLAR